MLVAVVQRHVVLWTVNLWAHAVPGCYLVRKPLDTESSVLNLEGSVEVERERINLSREAVDTEPSRLSLGL